MCLGIPGKITRIEDPDRCVAVVAISGVERKVNVVCVAPQGEPLPWQELRRTALARRQLDDSVKQLLRPPSCPLGCHDSGPAISLPSHARL